MGSCGMVASSLHEGARRPGLEALVPMGQFPKTLASKLYPSSSPGTYCLGFQSLTPEAPVLSYSVRITALQRWLGVPLPVKFLSLQQ